MRPPHPTLREALAWWWKLGWISFGGPAGQIAVMHRELVERRRWIGEHRFLHALNYCMVLPGPEAQQLATYIGWLLHGTVGGVVAGALFVAPSLLVLCALSYVYVTWGDLPAVAGALDGVRPAVTALVAHAAWRIGKRALRTAPMIAVATASLVARVAFDVPFPWIVGVAALAGAIGGPTRFAAGGGHVAGKDYGPAVIDDDTPLAGRAINPLLVLAIGAALAATGLAMLDGTLRDMGGFFTTAALLTFGGAYAVLPYVYEGAVERFGWLTGPQMIDGLALGETTPGPLIMVVAFVGYVGAVRQAVAGDPLLAGVLGASVATFFTVLPSFVFILAGAPAVEATRRMPRLTAPLAAVTAAVVGVIVDLGRFFAWHTLWPEGWDGGIDWIALGVGAAAAWALFARDVGVVRLVLACAIVGLLTTIP
ncbi:MAG: chromate efflux transporter [Myxococcota bacterium]